MKEKINVFNSRWRCCILTCFIIYLSIQTSNCAPSHEHTTQISHPLTTVQYYVKTTPKPKYDTESDYYYEDVAPKRQINPSIPLLKDPSMTPPEVLMSIVKTVLDVVKKINSRHSNKSNANSTALHQGANNSSRMPSVVKRSGVNATTGNAKYNSTGRKDANGRGMDEHEIYYDDIPHDHYHHHPVHVETTTTEAPKVMKQSRYTDPWAGYYDFIITEGSFKFWSGFQLFTAAILLYSALAAIYYAKFNPIQPDYDTTYDDYFFGRSLEGSAPEPSPTSGSPAPGWISSITGMGTQAFQHIMDSINPNKKFK